MFLDIAQADGPKKVCHATDLGLVNALDVVEHALVATQLRQRLARLPGRVHVAPALPLDAELARVPWVGRRLRALPLTGSPCKPNFWH